MHVFIFESWLLLLLCAVKSDVVGGTQCDDHFVDIENKPISNIAQYCENKSCIIKCCDIGKILDPKGKCSKETEIKELYSKVNYSDIDIHSWDGSTVNKSKKEFAKEFIFVTNEKFKSKKCSHVYPPPFYILEDGSLKLDNENTFEPWIDINKMDYCIDFRIRTKGKVKVELVYKEPMRNDIDIKSIFLAIGMLTSSFFLLMVLIVYCLLPNLRNIVGLVLMAYVFTLLLIYVLKAIVELSVSYFSGDICKNLSPFLYYISLSSFFWLTIMSFDVWWTLRGNRKCRDIHRKGQLVKFMWYCLYAWGTPLLFMIAAVIVDNLNLENWPSVTKPGFKKCFAEDDAVWRYLHIPIAIITVVNLILFIMTAYNIWLIKRAVNNCQDYRKSKMEENRFAVYIKLTVMMGVNWGLELLPDLPTPWFIIVNFLNVFLGVAIFFLFVFKKSILIMLCKRFNINNSYVQKLQSSQYSKTETTRSFSSSKSSRVPNQDTQESTPL